MTLPSFTPEQARKGWMSAGGNSVEPAGQCGGVAPIQQVLVGNAVIERIAVRVSKGTAVIEGHQLIDGHDPAHLNEALAVNCQWAQARSIPVLPLSPLHAGAVS